MAEENKILVRLNVDAENGTAAIKNFKGQVIKAAVPVEDLNRVLAENNLELARTTGGIGRQMAALKKQRSNLQINSKAFQNNTKALRFYQSQLDMSTGATGSASSAAMELGRVMSDAPYGIRGVANNISQFASQMAFATKQTGSLKLAVKDLFKALMGPLGILLAIQAVVAAMEKMSMAKQKAKEESKKLNEALKKEVAMLEGYNHIMNDSNSSLEQRNDAIIAAIASSKTLSDEILKSQSSLLAQGEAYEFVLEQKRKQIEIDDKLSKANSINQSLKEEENSIEKVKKALITLKEERTNALEQGMDATSINTAYNIEKARLDEVIASLEKRNSLLREAAGLIEPQEKAIQGTKKFFDAAIKSATDFRDQMLNDPKAYADQTKVIEGLIREREALTGKKKKTSGSKPKKLSPFATPEELEIDIKNSERAQIRLQKRIQDARLKKELNDKLSEATSEEARRKIREEYQVKRLQNQLDTEQAILDLKIETEKSVVKTKTQNHIDDLKKAQELFEYKMDLEAEAGNITKAQRDELVSNSKSKLYCAIIQAEEESQISLSQITSKYAPVLAFLAQFKKVEMDALTSGFGAKKDDDNEEKGPIEKMKEKLEGLALTTSRYMEVASGLTSFLDGEFQRQMTIEQNKTNAINNELRERLNNENLSAGERKNIQLKIARNDEELRKKQEKIQKKRFKMQKAANIVMALADTYRNAVTAYGSQLIVGDPTSPVRGAIAAKFAIASGLINVAMIARQKFKSSAGAAPSAGALGGGGSGSGTGDRSFNFNLAGASRENQLAQTLQGRFDQPLQAYVVSRDITNQQQLDMDIQNNASFG